MAVLIVITIVIFLSIILILSSIQTETNHIETKHKVIKPDINERRPDKFKSEIFERLYKGTIFSVYITDYRDADLEVEEIYFDKETREIILYGFNTNSNRYRQAMLSKVLVTPNMEKNRYETLWDFFIQKNIIQKGYLLRFSHRYKIDISPPHNYIFRNENIKVKFDYCNAEGEKSKGRRIDIIEAFEYHGDLYFRGYCNKSDGIVN